MAEDFNPFALGAKTLATAEAPAPAAGPGASDFDPFRDGGAKSATAVPGRAAMLTPRSYLTVGDPDAHWRDLYSGLTGIDHRLDEGQRRGFSLLGRVSANPEEDRARAINQSFLSEKLGIAGPMIDRNWEATKVAFAKEQLGVDAEKLSDKQVYSWIGQRLGPRSAQPRQPSPEQMGKITAAGPKPELLKPWTYGGAAPLTEDWYRAKQTVSTLWDSLNQSMIDKIPDPPENLPDIVVPGWPMMISPAVAAGVWTGAVKPLLSGLTSPAGIATLGIGTELHALSKVYPLAKAALTAMSGGFAAWMGYGAVKAVPEARRVLADPKSTTQQKVAAVSAPVANGLMASLAALGTAFTAIPERAPKVAESMAGKRPSEAAELLRQEAVTSPPDAADALNRAATHFDEVAAYEGGPEQWEAAAHPQERIAAAAIKTPDGNVVEGPAHEAIRLELADQEGAEPKSIREQMTEASETLPEDVKKLSREEAVAAARKELGPEKFNSGLRDFMKAYASEADLQDTELNAAEHAAQFEESFSRLVVGKSGLFNRLPETASPAGHEEGFVTSSGRFVDRVEARQIAEDAGQVVEKPVDIGPRDESVSTGTGIETPKESKMISEWKESIAKELQSHEVDMSPQRSSFGRTALKNSYDEMERMAYGFADAPPTERQGMAESNARAEAVDKTDPGAGERLAEAIKANPNHRMTGDQWALLLRYKAQLSEALNRAADTVYDPNATIEVKAAAKVQVDESSKKLLDLMNARRVVISQSGRDLRWQQAIMHEDYSFATQETLFRAAKGDAELTDGERSALQGRIDALQKKQAELEAHIANQTSVSHTQAADRAVSAMKASLRRARPFRTAESVRLKLNARAQESIKYLLSGRQFTLGPDVLYHMSVVGADRLYSVGLDFTKWSAAMVEDLGEKVKPILAEVWEASKKLFHAENREGLIADLKAKTPEEREKSLSSISQELARAQIEQGAKDRDAIVDAVHADLEKAIPGISRRETMDAISGYGKFKALTHDQITDELRDIKGQLQQVAKLEDIAAGKRPKKTGVEQRQPSEEETRLRKEVAGAVKMEEVTPERPVPTGPVEKAPTEKFELPGAMDFGKMQDELNAEIAQGVKDRLNKQIASLEKQIEARTKTVRERRGTVYDDESNRLKARRDELKTEFDAIFGRKEMTNAQRLNIWKAFANRRIEELQERLAAKDFEPKAKRPPLVMDEATNRLKGELERIKQDFAIARAEAELAKRPKWQKALSEIQGLARASALSGYHTLVKLASFSLGRFAETPVTESYGALIRKVPGVEPIAKLANLEAGGEYEGLARYYSQAATKGMTDAWETLQTGKSTLKAELADRRHTETPVRWYDYFGLSHMVEKSPLLRGEFELRLEKSYQSAIANGLDVTDPLVKGAIRKEAFDYAQRAILQENNQFSDWINSLTQRLEAANPKVGKPDVVKMVISTFIKTFLTKGIVKTPANYIAQTLERTPLGLAKGTAQAVVAHIQGIEKLTPEEANVIYRLLKVGSVGSAMFVFGAIDATKDPKDRIFGGYYQSGDKRGENDVGWGKLRVAGHEFPHLVTHNPLTESAQMGSTFMRVMKSRLSKKDAQDRGALAGSVAAWMGLASEAPIVNPITQQAEAVARGEGNKIIWDEVAGLIPQLVQNIAQDIDGKSRKAETFTQRMELTVPGLRSNVPETKAQKKRDIKERLKK